MCDVKVVREKTPFRKFAQCLLDCFPDSKTVKNNQIQFKNTEKKTAICSIFQALDDKMFIIYHALK